MGKRIDIKTGEKFGRLTVIRECGRRHNRRAFLCICDCGKKKEQRLDKLNVKASCGCLGKENFLATHSTHNCSQTKLYVVWKNMRQRCLNNKCPIYHRYGARGITICPEWSDFAKFKEWCLVSGFKEGLAIERINNDLGYFPANCKWATRLEQANNTSQNMNIKYQGRTQTLSQWARELGLDKGVLLYRLRAGWPTKEAFTIPINGGDCGLSAVI